MKIVLSGAPAIALHAQLVDELAGRHHISTVAYCASSADIVTARRLRSMPCSVCSSAAIAENIRRLERNELLDNVVLNRRSG